jgi:hypothetical protein
VAIDLPISHRRLMGAHCGPQSNQQISSSTPDPTLPEPGNSGLVVALRPEHAGLCQPTQSLARWSRECGRAGMLRAWLFACRRVSDEIKAGLV